MTAAMVAAVAATLGIVVGRFWDVRSESARWRRDQMVTSYQRLAEAYRRTVEGIRTVALADPADPALPGLVAQVRSDSEWDDGYVAVLLHGSPEVAEAALAMDVAVTELFYEAQDRRHGVEDWYRIRIPAGRAQEGFIDAVRAELDLKPIPVKYRAVARQVPAPASE
ncbi:MAG: hypothetical protein JWN03_5697 [Nocardia sp.]|uniref:hypothetical protein n=1 Tax=Nocardia sp. TaxID=1821 RepID=UPI0026260543|nr:hypothetical protein [Nocardia sp.]MCU1645422.1 hypothetical protein [Nocardia sp.]